MFETSEMMLPEDLTGFDEFALGSIEEGGVTAFDEIPSPEMLSADLEAAMAAEEGAELDLALAESELSPEEELAFAAFEEPTAPSLEQLVSVLQRYPGLKLTITF